MCTGGSQLSRPREPFQFIAVYKPVSHKRWFWKILFYCSCSCHCLCVNHVRKIVRKLKPRKILGAHFFNKCILLLNASLWIYPYKRKCRWLRRTVFLPLKMMVHVLLEKIIYVKCSYLWSFSGREMVWQQLQHVLFYLKAAGRKYWQSGWVKRDASWCSVRQE